MIRMDNDRLARPRSMDWDQLLLAYFHDPVDKALDIRGHESRAARYASRALDRDVTREEIKRTASLGDQLAAKAERVPMPTAGPNGERAVGLQDGRIEVRHPVSAQPDVLVDLAVDESGVLETIGSIVDGLPDPRRRFLALWRLLPERLGQKFARLPADTRVPDHTLIQHADITSGLYASRGGARTVAHCYRSRSVRCNLSLTLPVACETYGPAVPSCHGSPSRASVQCSTRSVRLRSSIRPYAAIR